MLGKLTSQYFHDKTLFYQKKWKRSFDRVFILPTRFGLYFIFIVFILFLMSLSYGHSLAITGTFIFVSIIVVSAHFTNFNLYDIHFDPSSDLYLFEGEDLSLKFNNHWAKPRPDIDIDVELVDQTNKVKSTFHGFTSFESNSSQKTNCKMRYVRRGKYEFSQIKLSTAFPFGLFRSWKFLELGKSEVWIFPKPLRPEYSRNQVLISQFSPHKTRDEKREGGPIGMKNGAESFYEHTPYQNGVIKRIDWKVYSRTHQLFEKNYKDEVQEERSINRSDFMHLSIDLQLSYMTFLVLDYTAKGYRFTLRLDSNDVQHLGEGKPFELECLKRLAQY